MFLNDLKEFGLFRQDSIFYKFLLLYAILSLSTLILESFFIYLYLFLTLLTIFYYKIRSYNKKED